MTISKTGAYFYLEYDEVAIIAVTSLYKDVTTNGKTYSELGEKQWIHIPKLGGSKPTFCPGLKDGCSLCKEGNKATVQYKVSVFFEGNEYYMNMQKSLGDMIIERQKMLIGMGLAEDEAVRTPYKVRRLPKGTKPYWEVLPIMSKKEAKEKKVEAPVVDLEDVQNEQATKDVVLSTEEMQQVERYKINIKKRCDEAKTKGEVFDFRPSLEAGLKKLGWSDAKVAKAQTLYDSDGVFNVSAVASNK